MTTPLPAAAVAMTKDALDGLRDALAKASGLPWKLRTKARKACIDADDADIPWRSLAKVVIRMNGSDDYSPEGQANAALIVAAVNALPGLLDELEALRAQDVMRANDYAALLAQWKAAEARALTAPAGVPDGYVVVPREPTEAMLRAGKDAEECPALACERIYRAMLAAAAPPSDAPGEVWQQEIDAIIADRIAANANPSPAEQGAREDEQSIKADAYDLIAETLRGAGLLAAGGSVSDAVRSLAAGRVGVAEAWHRARNAWMTASRHGTQEAADAAAIAVLTESLAGPLVAGEVVLPEGPYERVARLIYEQWSHMDGYVSWVERGNSDMQCKARRLLHAALCDPLVYADTAKGVSDGRV